MTRTRTEGSAGVRIRGLLRRDLLSARKDPMVMYLLLSTVLFALALRLFLGGFQQLGVTVVLTEQDARAEGAQRLAGAAAVEVVDDLEALERRVRRPDQAVGLVRTDTGWQLVRQGDEEPGLVELAGAAVALAQGAAPEPPRQDVGRGGNAALDWVAVFYGLGGAIVAGVIMGFLVIEDKESRTLPALGVTPLSRREYLTGRLLLVALAVLPLVLVPFWLLGTSFDVWQTVAATVVSIPVGALIGFGVGAASTDTITGIANLKFANLATVAPGALTFFVPERAELLFWPLPQYWAFESFRLIVMERATWPALAVPLAAGGVSGLVACALLAPVLRRRIGFGRS